MKRSSFYFLIPLIIFFSCESKSGDRIKKNKKPEKAVFEEFSLKKKDIGIEYTDSLSLDSYLSENTHFKPYSKKLYKFYSRRDFQLAWSEEGKFLPQVSMFLNILRNATNEGMEAGSFEIQRLEKKLEKAEENSKQGAKLREEIDLLLSASYFKYSRKIWKGIVHPEKEGLDWYVNRKKIKFGKTLDSILDSKEANPFTKYMPVHPEYHSLVKVLNRYRTIEKNGGWPSVNIQEAKILQIGDTSAALVNLRTRLAATDDLVISTQDSIFTSTLEKALKKFQARHGLKQDGVLGPSTIKALNVPVEEKIRQILVNLERWRWVPEIESSNYIIVNIPEFKLRVFEDEKEIKEMKVIVGEVMNTTPVFNDELDYIVFNPYWNIPKSIAVKEILPALRKNPDYLKGQNMEAFKGYDYANPIDAKSINWDSIKANNFPYQFRQKPGPYNSLGLIKFLFPNNFSVYLHDTPADHLFKVNERDFSHGCIRVEDPVWLADYTLTDWEEEEIKETLGKSNKWVKLNKHEKLPVFILYFTVWTDSKGSIQFREDIYNHDKELEGLLFEQ